MYNKLIKSRISPNYIEWIKNNEYSILSPIHRGIYADLIFRKYCNLNNIIVLKINKNLEIIEQIPADFEHFFKKKELNNLKKYGKIGVKYLCFEKNKPYFVEVKMGTSAISSTEKQKILKLENSVFEFRVYEDGEILIKKI